LKKEMFCSNVSPISFITSARSLGSHGYSIASKLED
jgi:hypothetical protein